MTRGKPKEEKKLKEEQSEIKNDEENVTASSDSDTVTARSDSDEAVQTETSDNAETKYLRLAADFQNYKRRMEKERFERYSEGKKDFAEDLLPVLDIFDVALTQYAELKNDDHDRAVIEGMEMILKKFQEALIKNGVTEIEALGADFDPNFHHAVIMEPSDKYASQKVSEVLQKGYKIGERVIRPSMVKVAE